VPAHLKFSQEDRDSLVVTVVAEYPGFNVLINNAGIQKKASVPCLPSSSFSLSTKFPLPNIPRLKIKIADSFDMEEMAVNFEAPVHLCQLVIPHIQGESNATM
jgi:short-subunit dehydrogenase involved in D-alanine esterification of teichoic acids